MKIIAMSKILAIILILLVLTIVNPRNIPSIIQLTSMCELACQIFQKKKEEKRIEEEQAAKARYLKIPACCDDDDDDDSAITPILSTEETENSLSMRDEHLDIISATESDEVIKSSFNPKRVVPRNYDPKGARFLIASRFPTFPLASSPAIVEPLRIELLFLEDQFQEDPPPESPMTDNRTMAELLQAPTEGYEDAIVIPEITANNFELRHGLINLERFNDLLRACPHHGFFELHQLDTFYNALNVNDQDSLNSVAGGNFLDKIPRECLKIIESKSKVRQSRAKAVVAKIDLGASINLLPLSVWEGLLLPELTPTCMILELADRLVSKPIDPRVPLILGRCFLKTIRALIDVHKGELTLHIGNESITYNLDQTVRYFTNYNQMTANKIDVIESACEEYSQEVLGFSNVTTSGTPTPQNDPIVSATSPTLTQFEDSDFLLFEEADTFLGLEDDPDSSKINPFYYDPEGDILLLEAILNSKPSPPLTNQEQNLPSLKEKLKAYEAQTVKSSADEPLEVELKDLPYHLEYSFLEGDNKFPIIIAKELGSEEKSALIKVLKSHKRAITWKLSDIQGGFTVVENEENELIPTRLVTGWRVCIDYRKLNEATRKDHFPLLFMDQMLERLARNEYYCFLDGFFGYFQIPIDPRDQEKTTFTCPYGTFAYRRMPFGLCNAPDTFQSHFMVKEGIVLGHKISKNGIEVERAKVDVIDKLPHPTTVKEKEMLAVVYAFEKFRSYLIMNKSIVHKDHSALKYLFAKKDAKVRLLRWVLLLQEFDFKVLDTKGAENLAADHLSR
nr:reverse transcriptase domain-containing protein [Tanacetum cinerariifolium]